MKRLLWSLGVVALGLLICIRIHWREAKQPAPVRPDAAVLNQRPAHAAYRVDDGRVAPVNGAIVTRALAKEPASLPPPKVD